MATKKAKIKKIQAGIKAVQAGIDKIKAERAAAGSGGTPGQFGAGGRGEVLGVMQADEEYNSTLTPEGPTQRLAGESDTAYRSRINNTPFNLAGGGRSGGGGRVSTLSDGDSAALAKQYGLTGLGYDKTFGGLTASQAKDKAEKIRTQLKGQTSALTSSRFNQESTSGIKKASENLNAKLKDVTNDSWLSKGSKEEKKKTLLESTANEIAKLFASSDDFGSQMNSNPGIKSALDSFVKLGGNLDSVTSRISKSTQVAEMPQGENGKQDLSTYLSLDPGASKEQTQAWDDLVPERDLAQMEIMQLASIPEKYRAIYFGTPEEIGILEEKRVQAEERKKIIAKKAKDDISDLRAQADYAIDQNNADAEIASSEIETNRLNSKNYMVGALAKLGALNTTGAAPQAVANIEEKYNKQATELRMNLSMANRGIEIKLKDAINDVEAQRDEDILAVKEDLTLDKEQVYKKIMELEASSAKETFNILGKFAKDFRTQTEKYIKESKKAAEKYTKELASVLSDSDLEGLVEGAYIVKGKKKGVLLPDGTISPIALTPAEQKQVEAAGIVGKDTIQFFLSTEPSFRDYFIQNAIGSGTRLSIGSVKQQYQKWKEDKAKEAEAKKKKSTTSIDDI